MSWRRRTSSADHGLAEAVSETLQAEGVSEAERAPLGRLRRARLTAEMLAVFIGAPLLMQIAVFHFGVPLFYALPPACVAFLAFLYFDRSFNLRQEFSRSVSKKTLISIATIFVLGCALATALVALFLPGHLFALAAERPGKWLKILVLYPFTSVLPQELAYRTFFFHRYGALFRNPQTRIVANAAFFSFGHILFRNWIALAGTFITGLLFAWRYERTRTFAAVYVEHVLWGWFAFTVGLGVYFFTGVRNPAW